MGKCARRFWVPFTQLVKVETFCIATLKASKWERLKETLIEALFYLNGFTHTRCVCVCFHVIVSDKSHDTELNHRSTLVFSLTAATKPIFLLSVILSFQECHVNGVRFTWLHEMSFFSQLFLMSCISISRDISSVFLLLLHIIAQLDWIMA